MMNLKKHSQLPVLLANSTAYEAEPTRFAAFCETVNFLLTHATRACIYAAVLTQLNSMSGNNSVVECNLAKVEVASSNLVSRSNSDYKRFGAAEPFFIN